MYSNIYVTLTVFVFGTAVTKSSEEKRGDVKEQIQSLQKFKSPTNDFIPYPDTWQINPNLNSLWAYRPASIQSHHPDEFNGRSLLLKTPHSLTRLAKSLALGYDSYFNKELFEPFERRQRPVTLISFRKNGLLPRIPDEPRNEGYNIAELQSPYNEISSFWQHEAGPLQINM